MYIRKWLDKKGCEFIECDKDGIRIGTYGDNIYIDTYVYHEKDRKNAIARLNTLIDCLSIAREDLRSRELDNL